METNPIIALFLALAVVIAGSRLAGSAARQQGQSRVLGELIIGIILGPTFLGFLQWGIFEGIHIDITMKELAELGVLFLMFIVGLEVNLKELAKVGWVATVGGFVGVIAPVALAFPIVILAHYSWLTALFAGAALAATSVSISAQVLLELGFLRTKVGNVLLATALIDDVLAILLVSLITPLSGREGSLETGELLETVLLMGGYLIIASGVAWFILPRAMDWIASQPLLSHAYGIPSFALVFMLLFGWSAEQLGGIATITGAFLAGVGISQSHDRTRHEIESVMTHIAYAFLVPIFFVNVGLEIDLSSFPVSAIPFTLALFAAAVISKVGGVGLGVWMSGLTSQEALQVGVCMISRGEVGLIIATLGVTVGAFTPDKPLFAALFMVILLTTLITPPLVRLVFEMEPTSA